MLLKSVNAPFETATMAAHPGQARSSIDTLRVVAFTLLVSYHVIGAGADSGLEIAYPHPLRFYADYLIGIRMPIFAMIAGYVYALRPVRLQNYSGFFTGKLRRLFIPGAVSALIFLLISQIMGNAHSKAWSDAWTVVFYGYAHYWYLQTMLVIFLAVGLYDGLLRGRGTVLLWVMALALTLSNLKIGTSFMSLHRVFDLLPHFVTGMLIQRYWPLFRQYRRVLLVLCLLAIGWHLSVQIQYYQDQAELIRSRRIPVSVLFSTCACLLMMLYMPRLRALEVLAPFAFTVYLYHVLGTAGMREVLHAIGIDALIVTVPLGLCAGICLPVLIHRVADKTSLTRKVMLGKRS